MSAVEHDLDEKPADPPRTGPGRRGRRVPGWAWALLGPVLAGLVVGVAWRLLAPTAAVQAVMNGKVLLVNAPKAPELFAAQDGTLVLLGALAGVVTGLLVVLRARRRPLTATAAAALGSVAGSALAVVVGQALGPASLASQGFRASAAAADQPSLVSPLSLHAPGAALVWPLLTLVVAALGHAIVASRLGRRVRRAEDEAAQAAAEEAAPQEPVPPPVPGG